MVASNGGEGGREVQLHYADCIDESPVQSKDQCRQLFIAFYAEMTSETSGILEKYVGKLNFGIARPYYHAALRLVTTI